MWEILAPLSRGKTHMRQKSTSRLPVALPAPPARFRFPGKSFSRSEAPLAPPRVRQLKLWRTSLVF